MWYQSDFCFFYKEGDEHSSSLNGDGDLVGGKGDTTTLTFLFYFYFILF